MRIGPSCGSGPNETSAGTTGAGPEDHDGSCGGTCRLESTFWVKSPPSVAVRAHLARPYRPIAQAMTSRKPQGSRLPRKSTHYTRSIFTDFTCTGFSGLFWRSAATLEILSAMLWPSTTSPKMVCLPVSHVVGATVMKNCEPLVFGPALAMASLPGLSKLCGDPRVSSSHWYPGP